MKRFTMTMMVALAAWMLLAPEWVLAAGGKSSELVVVADTRVISNGFMHYVANLYNTNITLFATWAAGLTAAYGAFLGFLMDFIMERTGLDLSSRKIVEH
ncbi:MAG TPA: hypothetical protein ENF48_02865 [Desulfobacteraceae bacterium]|nr:hypothetical protein [Deltaproteobacteria bacterium]MBW2355483.1 hypothetical protein [Deltaproteobacteria bacterium]RLB99105.1 MAG: hypothetical protein DRH76_00805 [Deltaproteobacteria bacterium]HDI59292.1 hypothetical protein [Desulfobacteraceae bacterium]